MLNILNSFSCTSAVMEWIVFGVCVCLELVFMFTTYGVIEQWNAFFKVLLSFIRNLNYELKENLIDGDLLRLLTCLCFTSNM